jgi:hypothetical protein
MHKRLLQVLALAVCFGLLPAAVCAKGKPADKGKSSEHGSKGKDNDKGKDKGQSATHGHHQGSATAQGPGDRPKGWDEGKKVGWGDCDVPPGLARKRGCDSHGFSARERAVHKAQARGFGDCAVAEDVARKRGCNSTGLSTRERAAERARAAERSTRRSSEIKSTRSPE